MGRRKDSLNSGTALKSPQLTALAARCRRSVWWANPIASPLSQTWKAIGDSNSPLLKKLKTRTLIWWSWRPELSSGEVEDSNSHLVKSKTRTLLSWCWRLELSSPNVEDSNSPLLMKMKTRTLLVRYLLLAQFHTLEPIVSTVRHVTGNDKDYLRKSPEWFGRNPRLTKGHYRVYCQPMLPVKLEVWSESECGWTQPFIPHDQQSLV